MSQKQKHLKVSILEYTWEHGWNKHSTKHSFELADLIFLNVGSKSFNLCSVSKNLIFTAYLPNILLHHLITLCRFKWLKNCQCVNFCRQTFFDEFVGYDMTTYFAWVKWCTRQNGQMSSSTWSQADSVCLTCSGNYNSYLFLCTSIGKICFYYLDIHL